MHMYIRCVHLTLILTRKYLDINEPPENSEILKLYPSVSSQYVLHENIHLFTVVEHIFDKYHKNYGVHSFKYLLGHGSRVSQIWSKMNHLDTSKLGCITSNLNHPGVVTKQI